MMYHIVSKLRKNKRRQNFVQCLCIFLSAIPAESGATVAQNAQTDRQRDAIRIQKVRRLIDKIRQLKTEAPKKVENEKCLKSTTDSTPRTMVREQSFPDPWMSWLDGWTFQAPIVGLEMEQTSTTTSNISLRLDQKVNGLFNNEFTDTMDDLDDNNMDSEWDKNYLESGKVDVGIEGVGVEDFLEAMDSTFPGDDFFNSFMDLSNFTDVQETDDKPDFVEPIVNFGVPSPEVQLAVQQVVPETENVIAEECGKKRKFSETDEDGSPMAAGLDHDYITKRPRTSTVTAQPVTEVEEGNIKSPESRYVERRIKNNIASKRSRHIRKMKFVEMESEAERLVTENQKMRSKIEELEKLAKEMKAALISKLAEKK